LSDGPHQSIHLSISAVVNSLPKGKSGRLPLTPIRRRYSHTLLSTRFKACGFVLVGENNNNTRTIFILV